jgi:hypothetical protein
LSARPVITDWLIEHIDERERVSFVAIRCEPFAPLRIVEGGALASRCSCDRQAQHIEGDRDREHRDDQRGDWVTPARRIIQEGAELTDSHSSDAHFRRVIGALSSFHAF